MFATSINFKLRYMMNPPQIIKNNKPPSHPLLEKPDGSARIPIPTKAFTMLTVALNTLSCPLVLVFWETYSSVSSTAWLIFWDRYLFVLFFLKFFCWNVFSMFVGEHVLSVFNRKLFIINLFIANLIREVNSYIICWAFSLSHYSNIHNFILKKQGSEIFINFKFMLIDNTT